MKKIIIGCTQMADSVWDKINDGHLWEEWHVVFVGFISYQQLKNEENMIALFRAVN